MKIKDMICTLAMMFVAGGLSCSVVSPEEQKFNQELAKLKLTDITCNYNEEKKAIILFKKNTRLLFFITLVPHNQESDKKEVIIAIPLQDESICSIMLGVFFEKTTIEKINASPNKFLLSCLTNSSTLKAVKILNFLDERKITLTYKSEGKKGIDKIERIIFKHNTEGSQTENEIAQIISVRCEKLETQHTREVLSGYTGRAIVYPRPENADTLKQPEYDIASNVYKDSISNQQYDKTYQVTKQIKVSSGLSGFEEFSVSLLEDFLSNATLDETSKKITYRGLEIQF